MTDLAGGAGSDTVRQEGWVYIDPTSGTPVYRASSLGNCLRSLVAARMGEDAFPPHQRFRAAMDASSGLEEEILRRFSIEMASSDIIWQQKRVELLVTLPDGSQVIIRGHLDGMYQLDDSILEVKAFGDNYFSLYSRGGLDALPNHLGEKYAMQMACYGYATQRKVRFVVGHKVKKDCSKCRGEGEGYSGPGEVDLCSKCNGSTEEWGIEEVDIGPPMDPADLIPLSDIQSRIATIEDYAARDELPDCTHGCRESDPYGESHLFAGPERGDDRLLELIARREELKEVIGEAPDPRKNKPGWGLQGQLAAVQDEIKSDYGHPTETRKYTVGPYSITIVANKGQERIDTTWLRKNHPDIAASALRLGDPFNQLIVKKAKGEKGEE